MTDPTIVAKEGSSFSNNERQAFVAMVRAGGEVGDAVLEDNVREAKCLVFLRVGDALAGVAALKNPRGSYRARISKSCGVDLTAGDYPFELGYIYVTEARRGKGHSSELVEAALGAAEGSGIFTTSRTNNAPMHAVLAKFGFSSAGQSYPGSNQNMIAVSVRPGTRKARWA